MSGAWGITWEIAHKRAQTKVGRENPLSDHAIEVLEALAMIEQQAALKRAFGAVVQGIHGSAG